MTKTLPARLSMNPDEVATVLLECGWREVSNRHEQLKPLARNDRRKARCFLSPKSRRALYVKVRPGDHGAFKLWPIVISPADAERARSVAPPAVRFAAELTHGSMYGRFPERRHRGEGDQHYGVALATEDLAALRDFLIRYDAVPPCAAAA